MLDWLLAEMPEDTLVGLDLSGSMPFADASAYFPGWDESPADARGLWALVERHSADDPHLSAMSFFDHLEASRYFRRHGGRRGDRFGEGRQGRFRITENAQRALGCRPYSNLNLVGAAQVGKSSLTGMRVLHRLSGKLPLWPFDAVPETGSLVVEIYTTIAAIAAGRAPGRSKMRSYEALNDALGNLGSPPVPSEGAIDDHTSDALLTAAWLRHVHGDAALWHPPGLDAVRFTEGWTFGAR
ncbi:4-Hydroxy-2-oxoglutarate aldolase / 2-dehydro-3-deoxyphosphogluconate aldolase [Sphingomonas antarctica]